MVINMLSSLLEAWRDVPFAEFQSLIRLLDVKRNSQITKPGLWNSIDERAIDGSHLLVNMLE